MMGHLNINSLSNKFKSFKSIVSSIFDTSLVSVKIKVSPEIKKQNSNAK